VTDVGACFPYPVAYHPSCHGLRSLGLGERPRRLLAAVRGLELRELEGAEECCGFGGTFAVKNPDVSAAMGEDKVRHAVDSGAPVLCGADNSCLMHLDGIVRRQGAPLRTVHLAEILASTAERLLVPAGAEGVKGVTR
jgi:L-lactate dehydrogenase complex protein LldE